MRDAIQNKLAANHMDEQTAADYRRKLQACTVILQTRAQ
jgi:hypothetical protein